MQLILEKEPSVDIKLLKSTLEIVLENRNIMNGVIENLVNGVNTCNKENISKSVNLMDNALENGKTNNIQYTEEESLTAISVDINKIENDVYNTHTMGNNSKQCYESKSLPNSSEDIVKIENEAENSIVKSKQDVINNREELNTDHMEDNVDAHQQQNECTEISINFEKKGACLTRQDINPMYKLMQIKEEINNILEKEVLILNLDAPPKPLSELEVNNRIVVNSANNCELYLSKSSTTDYTGEEKSKYSNNDAKVRNKDKELIKKGASNSNGLNNLTNKLTQFPVAEKVISSPDKDIDTMICHKNQNEDVEDNDPVCTIMDNESTTRKTTDIKSAIAVSDCINNDDIENTQLESMDVEFVDEDNNINKNLHEVMDVDNVNLIRDLQNDESNCSNNTIDSNEVIETAVKHDVISVTSKDEVAFFKDKNAGTAEVTANANLPKIQEVNDSDKSPLRKPLICRLSNTLNILSDDEEEPTDSLPKLLLSKESEADTFKDLETQKQSINNKEDDDDIVLIDEDIGNRSKTESITNDIPSNDNLSQKNQNDIDAETRENKSNFMESIELSSVKSSKESQSDTTHEVIESEDTSEVSKQISEPSKKPLIADGFLNLTKKKLSDMTREELEEFCVLRIVESIVDRSNLSEITLKLKTMAQSFEEYSKKAMVLSKQNRDLQVVLKSIQEEQKKSTDAITPLKITRSVGMQVLMIEKLNRKKGSLPIPHMNNSRTKSSLNQSSRPNKTANNNIPVPRLIPANNSAATPKGPTPQSSPNNVTKHVIPVPNGARPSLAAPRAPEKRTLSKSQSSDCVDLTDDEPPPKLASRSPAPPVRLVPSQNLLAPQKSQFSQVTTNSPRKVYIPISSPQGPNIRPGQTFMVKAAGPRARGLSPILPKVPQKQIRLSRVVHNQGNRHPASLPDAMKQYQPPNWKALPPAPDLKLSKVENGIVISWKIENYQEDSYEEIASYQLYAYQETSSPPNTSLWKKIGDVKALPLPMACTLTQFMSGFKYYFAVRAVDVKSRLGPFSLPGSILLLNKM